MRKSSEHPPIWEHPPETSRSGIEIFLAFFNVKLPLLRIITPHGTYSDASRSLQCDLAYYHPHHCSAPIYLTFFVTYFFPPPTTGNTDNTLPDQDIDSDHPLSIVSLFSGNHVICYIVLMDYMIPMTRAPPLETTQKTTTQIHLRSRALGTLLLLLKTSMIMLSLSTKLYTWTREHKFELVRKKAFKRKSDKTINESKKQAPDSYFLGGCSEGGECSVTYEERLTMKNAKKIAIPDRDMSGGVLPGGCSEDFPIYYIAARRMI